MFGKNLEEAGKRRLEGLALQKRATSSPETKGKELKMSNSVARIFKAGGKGPNLKGESGWRKKEDRKKMPPEEMRKVKERWCRCGRRD